MFMILSIHTMVTKANLNQFIITSTKYKKFVYISYMYVIHDVHNSSLEWNKEQLHLISRSRNHKTEQYKQLQNLQKILHDRPCYPPQIF